MKAYKIQFHDTVPVVIDGTTYTLDVTMNKVRNVGALKEKCLKLLEDIKAESVADEEAANVLSSIIDKFLYEGATDRIFAKRGKNVGDMAELVTALTEIILDARSKPIWHVHRAKTI